MCLWVEEGRASYCGTSQPWAESPAATEVCRNSPGRDQHEPGGVPGSGFPEEGGKVGYYACGKGFPNSGSEMNESSAIAHNGRKGSVMKSTSKVFRAFLPVILLLGFALVGHVEAAGTWSLTDSMSTARFVHTATLLSDGRVLVAGGFDGFTSQASAELYDPATGTWSTTGSMAFARHGHTATLLPTGKVLVAGAASTNLASRSRPAASSTTPPPAPGRPRAAW